MVVHRRSKSTKFRGRTTHGLGSKKKGRGAGNRGGRGMAGSGKRADHKKERIYKLYGPEYFGKHGFHRPQKMVVSLHTLNVGDLVTLLPTLSVAQHDGAYHVDLSSLGYDKLLGRGDVRVKLVVSGRVTARAREKIEGAGGAVVDESSA